jgi:hypothetical protein
MAWNQITHHLSVLNMFPPSPTTEKREFAKSPAFCRELFPGSRKIHFLTAKRQIHGKNLNSHKLAIFP